MSSLAHGYVPFQNCPNAYMLFSTASTESIQRENPGATSIQIAKIIAQKWKDLPDNGKLCWVCTALANSMENTAHQEQLDSSPNSLFDEISALVEVSYPLVPPKLLPISHGTIIAVECSNSAIVQDTIHYLSHGLDSPYWTKIFRKPVLPIYKDLQDEDRLKAYHDAIQMWQGVSDDMVKYVNFGTFKSIPDSPYHIPGIPVAMVGQYQLTTTKAIFESGPSHHIHRTALPDSWNTCVGPDVIIYIDESTRGRVKVYIHGRQMIIICTSKPGRQTLTQSKLQDLLLQLRLALARKYEEEDGIQRWYRVLDTQPPV